MGVSASYVATRPATAPGTVTSRVTADSAMHPLLDGEVGVDKAFGKQERLE